MLRLEEADLYLLHEALAAFVFEIAGTPRQVEVDDVLALRDRIGARIDDLILAAGGDPR